MTTAPPIQAELARQLWQQKRQRRRQLAALPIEEKIRLLIRLQRLANEVRQQVGRPVRPEWNLPTT